MALPFRVSRTFFGRLAKYLAATSYTIDFGYLKNRIISVCKRPVRKFSIIVTLRYSYLLGYFKVMHAYYKHVTSPNVNNDLPPKSMRREI